MTETGLFALFGLHRIDEALIGLKKRAAALDVGQKESAILKKLEEHQRTTLAPQAALVAELKKREIEQKNLTDKIAHYTKELYSGKTNIPKEIRAIEAEIAQLKQLSDDNDLRLLELFELAPPAQAQLDEVAAKITKAKQIIAAKQKAAAAEHKKLEEEFQKIGAGRAAAAAKVPGPLMAQYDQVRKRTGDTGMARIVIARTACEACGMHVPEKAVEVAKDGRVVQCENCRRILYYSDSVL